MRYYEKKIKLLRLPIFLLFFVSIATLFQCAPSQKAANKTTTSINKTASNEVKPNKLDSTTLTIIEMLSKVSGISISGQGPNASIVIRGKNTVSGSSEPLFVVDGTVIGNGISSIYYRVQPNQIQSIRVLKGGDMSYYGSRGSSGVIEIRLKK